MISKTIALLVRAVQVVFSVVILSLIGHMISTSGWNQIPRQGGNAGEVNYAMFIAVFTLVSMAIFVPAALKVNDDVEFFIVTFGVDGLNLLFYMCGGIALAAAMDIHSCKNEKYTTSNRITNSSPDTAWRCREAQAATAFVWFTFITFIISTIFSARAWYVKENGADSDAPRPRVPQTTELNQAPMMVDEEARPHRFREFMGRYPTGGPSLADDERSDAGTGRLPRAGNPEQAEY